MNKKIQIAEFRELGFVAEINRRILHPHGFALFVEVDDDGNETLGGVFDERDDPEGWIMGEQLIEYGKEKAALVAADRAAREPARMEALGYWVQPLDEP